MGLLALSLLGFCLPLYLLVHSRHLTHLRDQSHALPKAYAHISAEGGDADAIKPEVFV